MLHDYIYLDIERVRSYHAQLAKGLLTERTVHEESEKSKGKSGEINLSLVKGGLDSDSRNLSSNTEKIDLHDYIVQDLLTGLENRGLLTDISRNHVRWQDLPSQDGMFVLTQGALRIMDYKYIASMLKNIPELEKLANRLSEKKQGKKSSLNTGQVRSVAEFIDQGMQDNLRVKIYPHYLMCSTGDEVVTGHFVASANFSLFRVKPSTLINLYGVYINANWKCLLQINRSSEFKHGVNGDGPKPNQDNGKFSIENALELVANHLSTVSDALQGVKYPNVAATPIAIYREIKPAE